LAEQWSTGQGHRVASRVADRVAAENGRTPHRTIAAWHDILAGEGSTTGRAMDQTATVEGTVRLVLGVARLGEADLAGWWSTHGLDRAGRYVLRRSFRRTWRAAALELDIESAAQRHHDATAGRRTALHLFSDELPFRRWATSWLAEQKSVTDINPMFEELGEWDLGTARAAIIGWTGGAPRAETVGEGLRLGELTRAEMDEADAFMPAARLLAATYATIEGPFRAPYFDLQG
jgi:hypothetical protein